MPETKAKTEHNVELRRLVGEFRDSSTGKVRRAGWDMDQLILNGRQISMVSQVPGAPVGLMAGVMLTPSEKQAVEDAIAKSRGGVKPVSIGGADPRLAAAFELLDDDDTDDEDDDE